MEIETMNCSEALRLARDESMRVSRLAWKSEEDEMVTWVGSLPSEAFGLTLEAFSISAVSGRGEERCPVFYTAWTAVQNGVQRGYASLGYEPSKGDILATDWFVVDNKGVARRGGTK